MTTYKTRTEAWRAMKNREDELEGQWREATVRAIAASLPDDPARRAIALLHMPDEEVIEFASGETLFCPRCQSEQCCEPDVFPCETFVLATGLEVLSLPAFPERLSLADYWSDPEIEVVLNHPTTYEPFRQAPTGMPLFVRHSEAMRMIGALRPESRAAVEALS